MLNLNISLDKTQLNKPKPLKDDCLYTTIKFLDTQNLLTFWTEWCAKNKLKCGMY